MTDNLNITVLGESLIEFSTNQSFTYAETFHRYYGGDVLNTAITAARFGSRVGFLTRVGNDSFTNFLLDSWQTEGLDISYVKVVAGYNGLYIVSIPPDGNKEVSYYRKKSAATTLSLDDIPEEVIERSSIVYSTGITQSLSSSANGAVKKAFSMAGEKKCFVAYDPNYREGLWSTEEAMEAMEEIIEYVDILLLSSVHDAERLMNISSPDKIIKYFWDRGVPTIAVKMGEQGCVIGHNGEINSFPHRNIEMVDSSGAGDVFNGGFLHGMSQGYTPFEAAKLAIIAASEKSRKIGAVRAIPTKEQVFAEFKRGEL